MALSDAVAAQVMGELHDLTKNIEAQSQRVEELANTVIAASKAIEAKKTALHSQNEKLLMDQVNEITRSIQDLKGIEVAIHQTAREHIDEVLLPLVNALDKDSGALRYYNYARDTYKRISDKMIPSLIILVVVFFMSVGMAFYAGMKIGAST